MKFLDQNKDIQSEVRKVLENHEIERISLQKELIWVLVKLITSIAFGSLVALIGYFGTTSGTVCFPMFVKGIASLSLSLFFLMTYYIVSHIDITVELEKFYGKRKCFLDNTDLSLGEVLAKENGRFWFWLEAGLLIISVITTVAGLSLGICSILV